MKHLQSNEVQALRRILRDQYSFHSIVKELVQNADDSKAERFHIGWTDNWPAKIHPLLTGPTVLVLNDGEFRTADAEVIWRVNEGAKGDDPGTIGKYGLGMKSVFHLCEGFFYLASPDQPAAEGRSFAELLTPWPPGGLQDDWSDLDAAGQELRKRIESWPHGCSRWFCLAVPLRKREHLKGAEAIIPGQFPTKDEFLQSYDLRELASLMPMLRHVRKITTWTWNCDTREFAKQATLTNDPERRVACAFPKLAPGKSKVLRVRVLADHDAPSPVLLASGRELLLEHEVFARHHTNGRWPTIRTLNPRTRRFEDTPEKAEPHCAAVFTSTSAEKGSLNIRWAVFLTLSTDTFPKISCDGQLHFELILHGQFFLDAGRRDLYKSEGDGDSLQETWNNDLVNIGVLPLVMPALEEFDGMEDLPPEAVANLTQALQGSQFFNDNRQRICCKSNWLLRVTLDDGACARWKLVDSSSRFLSIPQFDTKPDVAIETFPSLPGICAHLIVAESKSPRLSGANPSPWSTQPDELDRLFTSIPVTALTGSNTLTYLTEFLRLQPDPLPDEARQILVSKAAEAVADKGIQSFLDLDGLFREFVRALGTPAWVRIGPIEKEGVALYRDLNSLGLHHVVLPRELTPEGFDGGSLALDELGTIFTWLADSSSKRALSRTSTLALRVIEASTDHIDTKLNAVGEYPVFLVRDGNENSPEGLVSLNELHGMLKSDRLFAGGSAFLRALQRSLGDSLVYSLAAPRDSQPFHTLFGLSETRSCDADACIQLLSQHHPSLAVPKRRVELLDLIAPKSSENLPNDRLCAVRYLLHGNPDQADDLDTQLLTRSNLEHAGAIAKLAQLALERQDSEWRWIPDTLFRRLNADQQNALGLSPVDADAVEALLREVGTDWLRDPDFTAEESSVLLQEIQDPALWRKLPFHRTVDGRHVSIEASCLYMQATDDSPFPTELSHAVTVLERPQRESLLEKYRHNGVLPWTDASTIEVALAQAQPGDYSETMLEAIFRLCKQEGKIPTELLLRIKNTAWLPTINGSVVAPGDVIVLPQLEEELQRLLADPDVGNAFSCTLHLSGTVREHSSFGLLRQRGIFPTRRESLRLLALCLGASRKYRIGDLQGIEANATGLGVFLSGFHGVGADVLPALALLRSLRGAFEDDLNDAAQDVMPELRGDLALDTVMRCLAALSERHRSDTHRSADACLRVFGAYLRLLLDHAEYTHACLEEILLLNRAGAWKPPGILCARAEGIGDEWVVSDDLAELFLGDHRPKPAADIAAQADELEVQPGGAEVILRYVRKWDGLVPRQLIGGLLAFFGDEPGIVERAAELLSPRSLNNIRDELEWTVNDFPNRVGAEEDVRQVMAKQRFSVLVSDDASVKRVPNVKGGWFDARVGGEINTIFVGSLWFTSPGAVAQPGYRVKQITLREFDLGALSPQRRREVILESLRVLLNDVYDQQPTNLRAVWDTLAECNQIELEVVQDHLVDNAWFYFQQLGSRRLEPLDAVLKKHDELTYQRCELRHSSSAKKQDRLAEVENELASLPAQLKSLLETDEDAQQATLEAVRAKMADYEYSEQSIPFELFQNADDASAELANMLGTSASDASRRAIIVCDEEKFVFVHWGRPINEFARGEFSATRGRQYGYDRDLWKMLILSASDKSERAELVTGKFGLGFKSVFFATDCPRVLSGSLGFEVVGGFFPRHLAEEDLERLRGYSQISGQQGHESTVVELALRPSNAAKVSQAVRCFLKWLPITLTFSRRIKECTVSTNEKTSDSVVVRETPITGCDGTSVSSVISEGPHRGAAEHRSLVFRAENGGTILIPLDPRGVYSFDDSLPTFWVTVPTQTDLGAGIAVNGPFDVDVGRSQLAKSEKNGDIARTLGATMGRQLVELFDAAQDWPSFRSELRLADDASPHDLWSSLWTVLTHKRIQRNELLHDSIWRSNCGMHKLATERRSVPTALASSYRTLTCLRDIRAEIVGLLDTDEELFAKVSDWGSFKKRWQPSELVSATRCGRVFREATRVSMDVGTATLKSALEDQLDTVEVDPESAERFGCILNRTAINKWESGQVSSDETREIVEFLAELRFRTADDGCAYAKSLVATQAGGDETRRAAFAPQDRTLGPDYAKDGVEFFLLARSQLQAPPSLLAQWIIAADTEAARQAGLRYLLDGDLAQQVAHELREMRDGTWLEELTPTELQTLGFPEAEQDRLLVSVGTARGELVLMLGNEAGLIDVGRSVPPVDSRSALQAIYEWWSSNGDSEIRTYEARLYPDGVFPLKTVQTDTLDRPGWLSLFLIACTQTMGGITDTQTREFLRLCAQRGWMEDLSRADAEPGDWVRSWTDYVASQTDRIKYLHWVKQLVSVSVIARWLTEYVDALLAVDVFTEDFRLSDIMNPRSSSAFSGGGPDAPPLEPMLGIGQCFLIRELIRSGVLHNPRAHRWCFVPVARTRDLVARLGGPCWESGDGKKWEYSAEVFRFLAEHLDDPTFDRAFDIPLMLVAEREDLLSAITQNRPRIIT